VIVIDEYLAVQVLRGRWPGGLPDDEFGLPASRHWRLLQALHGRRGGQLSQLLSPLGEIDRAALRWPHPEVLAVLDTRPLLDEAARITARFGGGWIIGETIAAGLAHGRRLYYGSAANIGRPERDASTHLSVELVTLTG
jgi:hypothetical protein